MERLRGQRDRPWNPGALRGRSWLLFIYGTSAASRLAHAWTLRIASASCAEPDPGAPHQDGAL